MKKIFSLAVLIICFSFISNAQKGIQFFQGTWKEVLEKAKKEKKPIFVDAYTVWCGPCKYMAANVFTDEKVGEYYNKNFINYKFDMEKGEGPEFANKYRITAYPTLLYINAEGKIIHRVVGGKQPEQFIEDGKRAMVVFDYK
jgi:thiol:disulfide interchange protein